MTGGELLRLRTLLRQGDVHDRLVENDDERMAMTARLPVSVIAGVAGADEAHGC
jgi:hypothetical protein